VGRESSGLPDYRRLGGRRASAGLAMAMVRTPPVCSDFEERVTARLKALVTVLPDGAATFYAGANPNALAKSLFPYFCITPSNPKSAAIRGWPTFTSFVKVGTTRSDGTAFLSRQSELCFRGRGGSANQSVSRGQDKNPDASCTSSHLYKERKGGPAPPGRGLSECEALCEPERTAWHVRSPLPM
jgi:hypothetical protein